MFVPFHPSTDFNISPNIKFHTHLHSGSHIQTCNDWRTDKHEEAHRHFSQLLRTISHLTSGQCALDVKDHFSRRISPCLPHEQRVLLSRAMLKQISASFIYSLVLLTFGSVQEINLLHNTIDVYSEVSHAIQVVMILIIIAHLVWHLPHHSLTVDNTDFKWLLNQKVTKMELILIQLIWEHAPKN
jgi:hypothetical protein